MRSEDPHCVVRGASLQSTHVDTQYRCTARRPMHSHVHAQLLIRSPEPASGQLGLVPGEHHHLANCVRCVNPGHTFGRLGTTSPCVTCVHEGAANAAPLGATGERNGGMRGEAAVSGSIWFNFHIAKELALSRPRT